MVTRAAPKGELLPERAAADLQTAQANRTELLDKIAVGGTVTPAELGVADDAVRMSELRVDLAARNQVAAVEAARLARFGELVDSLTNTVHHDRLRALLDAYGKAVDALGDLYLAAEARQQGLKSDLREIGRLARDGCRPAGVDVELDDWSCRSISANGVRVDARDLEDAPHVLIRDAVATVIAGTPQTRWGDELVSLAGQYRTVRLERLAGLLADLDAGAVGA